MQWRADGPFGLLGRAFTVVITPESGQARLRIRHEFSGPLALFAAKRMLTPPDTLQVFAEAVKKRAEVIDRHL